MYLAKWCTVNLNKLKGHVLGQPYVSNHFSFSKHSSMLFAVIGIASLAAAPHVRVANLPEACICS